MTRDKIKNKIQLEIINVNKTITNKKRGIESKRKNKMKGWYEFFHGQHAIQEKKRKKKGKKK
jgi:hypothetical protein